MRARARVCAVGNCCDTERERPFVPCTADWNLELLLDLMSDTRRCEGLDAMYQGLFLSGVGGWSLHRHELAAVGHSVHQATNSPTASGNHL